MKKGVTQTVTHFGNPGAFAIARNQADGDWAAAVLLFRVKYYFDGKKKLLTRHGKGWIAMARSQWAQEAGLSESEMKNRALPKLRARPFITARAMRLTPNTPKLLWISLDLEKLNEWTQDTEVYQAVLNGAKFPGYEKPVQSYPYKEPE